jgi:multicomponent Na+:H+ antiporter subunit B
MRGPDSYLFKTVVRFAFFLVNVFALYLLLRGHNLPGGGFIGGIATAISLILLSLALGIQELHRIMRTDPVRLAASGLLLATLTGLGPMLLGHPFLEHTNFHFHEVPVLGELHLGTPLAFDVGVFLVVVGVTAKIIFVLTKSIEGLRALVIADQSRYSSPVEQPIEDHEEDPATEKPFTERKDHAS